MYVCIYFILAASHGMWDLSSPTRDQTHAPAVKVRSLNHWTTREVPSCQCLKMGRFHVKMLIPVSAHLESSGHDGLQRVPARSSPPRPTPSHLPWQVSWCAVAPRARSSPHLCPGILANQLRAEGW